MVWRQWVVWRRGVEIKKIQLVLSTPVLEPHLSQRFKKIGGIAGLLVNLREKRAGIRQGRAGAGYGITRIRPE